MVDPISLGISAIPSVIQGISGIFGIGQGKRMARANKFPTEAVNENLIKNANLAEQASRIGTPQEQYNNQQQAIAQNQASGVRMLNRFSRPTGVSSIVRASNEAMGNLNAQDAMARQNNQRFASQQRGVLANEQNRVWDWNRRQRYLQNAQAASQTINAGRQNAFGGLQGLSQLGQLAMSDGQNSGGSSMGGGGRYLGNQLQQSMMTGYGMNPFTPNA